MPDPERLLPTLRRAVQAFRDTPGRRGRVVRLEGATEVFATGDLHSNLENFRQILKLADLARHPGRHLVLQEVIHGTNQYPAGGERSHQLLDLVAALKCQYPRQVHFLPGNHELSQATRRRILKNDLNFNQLFEDGVATAYGARADQVYGLYLELFAAAPLALRTPNRVLLCHSLPTASQLDRFDPADLERDVPEEADLLPGGSVHSLLWGRDVRPETAAAFLRKMDADLVITGHIPCEEGYALPNDRQVILDCMGWPACYCLFPADRPLTHAELAGCIHTL